MSDLLSDESFGISELDEVSDVGVTETVKSEGLVEPEIVADEGANIGSIGAMIGMIFCTSALPPPRPPSCWATCACWCWP